MSAELVRRLYLDTPVIAFVALTVLLFASSYVLKHYIYARRFKRTDALGVQRFTTYWQMQLVLFVERGAIRVAQFVFAAALFFLMITASRLMT